MLVAWFGEYRRGRSIAADRMEKFSKNMKRSYGNEIRDYVDLISKTKTRVRKKVMDGVLKL